jgi:hypothetical protein
MRVLELGHLACPTCGEFLERGAGRHGLVWICHACRGGAVTVPFLRKIAPRGFVNQVWQAALHQGRPSRRMCPACTQPFIELGWPNPAAGPSPIKVCVRCYWVWFSSELLDAVTAGRTSIDDVHPRLGHRGRDRVPAEARRRRIVG